MKRALTVLLVIAAACARKADSGDTARVTPDTAKAASIPSAAPSDSSSVSKSDSAPAAPRAPATTPRSRETGTPSPKPTSPSPDTKQSASDTLRGIVAIVGTEHDKHVIVRPPDGRAVTLEGPLAMLVGRASGADVWVAGSRGERNAMTVAQFAVRTVDGIAALDGTLASEAGQLVLVTPDGKRHRIANPPDALRVHVGARVWVSGNLDQGPVAYGIIQDRP